MGMDRRYLAAEAEAGNPAAREVVEAEEARMREGRRPPQLTPVERLVVALDDLRDAWDACPPPPPQPASGLLPALSPEARRRALYAKFLAVLVAQEAVRDQLEHPDVAERLAAVEQRLDAHEMELRNL